MSEEETASSSASQRVGPGLEPDPGTVSLVPLTRRDLMSQAEDLADTGNLSVRVNQSLLHPPPPTVPAGHQAPPPPRSPPLLGQHLPGGLGPVVVPVDASEYINSTWSCGGLLANVFVLINLLGQLGSCLLILSRNFVQPACWALFGIIVLQVDTPVWTGPNLQFSDQSEPRVQRDTTTLSFMPSHQKFRTFFDTTYSVHRDISTCSSEKEFLQDLLGTALMLMVAVGFKTKLAALTLVVWLLCINVIFNAFWNVPTYTAIHDFLKCEFFQTTSVIGGLPLVVVLGPGGVSWTRRRKSGEEEESV
ncbi:hypothetical protein CRENBAI_001795 [Crenichthys baileyi]|uniref:Surfeit locus protein 4 n=1 Tax=Crenichthys baileyi TaxID=28760 RepID=A0AAV9SLU6_9TELE